MGSQRVGQDWATFTFNINTVMLCFDRLDNKLNRALRWSARISPWGWIRECLDDSFPGNGISVWPRNGEMVAIRYATGDYTRQEEKWMVIQHRQTHTHTVTHNCNLQNLSITYPEISAHVQKENTEIWKESILDSKFIILNNWIKLKKIKILLFKWLQNIIVSIY